MVKLLFEAEEHYKQNIHLIVMPNNSYNEIILELSHVYQHRAYRNQYL